MAITLVKHRVPSQVLKFLPPPSRPSLQCPPHPIAIAYHSAVAMPRQDERRSCSLSLAITARFNAMMTAKLMYAAICAARITTKGSWVIKDPGNSAYRPVKLLSPSKNIREPLRRLFRAFRTSFSASALFGYDEAGAPNYVVSGCKGSALELPLIAHDIPHGICLISIYSLLHEHQIDDQVFAFQLGATSQSILYAFIKLK